MTVRTGATAILFLLAVSAARAADIGTFGMTYRISEQDALVEIEERARQVDWHKVLDQRKVEDYQGPPERERLPRAKRNRSRLVDMTYTTEIDIPDGRGGTLYPKGYTFNPLDYVTYPRTLVVIDGTDPEQVKWFSVSGYDRRLDVMLLLTGGSFGAVSKKISRPLYYADRRIIQRLRVKAVPSVIRQKGRVMEVSEVVVPSQQATPEGRQGQRQRRR